MQQALFRQPLEASVMGLETAQRALSAELSAAGLAAPVLRRVELVVEELVMNIIMHGLDDPTDQQIELAASIEPDGCHLLLEDAGRAFDPSAAPSQDSRAGESGSLGGLGLVLVRRMARDLRYERLPEGRNRLRLRVPNEAAATGPAA